MTDVYLILGLGFGAILGLIASQIVFNYKHKKRMRDLNK